MAVASSLCIESVEEAEAIDVYFNDINAYIYSLRAPAYPFEIDETLAAQGLGVFMDHCAGCHGTYADTDDEETYPNLLIPLEEIGTDPVVALGGTDYAPYLVDWFNGTFWGSIIKLEPGDPFSGYVPPPLDGIWATGPFLHNGSVPNIALVLDSSQRPTYWKRVDFDSSNFDPEKLGWPYIELDYGQDGAEAYERKYIYDTTFIAHGNQGHRYGDELSDEARRAVLEYLKTL
jgi:mono/diheme cytochrome c family protein